MLSTCQVPDTGPRPLAWATGWEVSREVRRQGLALEVEAAVCTGGQPAPRTYRVGVQFS